MRRTIIAKLLLQVLALSVFGTTDSSWAQVSDDTVKLGVLDDMTGPYAENSGTGDVIAVKMAIDDFGGKVLGKPIELVSGDLQNKVDVGVAIARKWFDVEHVDAVFGLGNSAVALAVQKLALEKNRINISTVAATSELTGKACSPNAAHWVYDTYSLAKGAATAVVKNGGSSWFFITADYAFGHSLEANASDFVKALGGTVVGSVRHPTGSADFSSFILQAQSSGAKIIGVANGGRIRCRGPRSEIGGSAHAGHRNSCPRSQSRARSSIRRSLLLGPERRNTCVLQKILERIWSAAD
jgi:branched-chain amino acid transport system substrate-binding protein